MCKVLLQLTVILSGFLLFRISLMGPALLVRPVLSKIRYRKAALRRHGQLSLVEIILF